MLTWPLTPNTDFLMPWSYEAVLKEYIIYSYMHSNTQSKVVYKLARNKNARHIFPRHFLTVAMIGIICLYLYFVLYIFHTRSLIFKYLHYFRSYDNHCTKCTCTSCAPTTRLFDAKYVFEIALLNKTHA